MVKSQTFDLEELDLKANPGAFSTFDAEILVPEVQKLKKGQVYLEVGVDKGKSLSIAHMVAKEGVRLYGVDIQADPGVEGTTFLHMDSQQAAENWFLNHGPAIDVLFIDADHSYLGASQDIHYWYPHMAKHGVMLFHDCDASSPGVVRAVHDFADKHGFELFESPNQRCSMARIRL